jgi:hypothetical protein
MIYRKRKRWTHSVRWVKVCWRWQMNGWIVWLRNVHLRILLMFSPYLIGRNFCRLIVIGRCRDHWGHKANIVISDGGYL